MRTPTEKVPVVDFINLNNQIRDYNFLASFMERNGMGRKYFCFTVFYLIDCKKEIINNWSDSHRKGLYD